jgi:hypothetical protein
MMLRVFFWDMHGSISQKTNLNKVCTLEATYYPFDSRGIRIAEYRRWYVVVRLTELKRNMAPPTLLVSLL